MGYCHYWEVDAEIDAGSFSSITADFQRMVLALDDLGVRLAGPRGEGLPEIDADRIAFNGVWHCGHIKNDEIVILFPATGASGIGNSSDAVEGSYFGMGTLLKHRTCDGNCSYETFVLSRKCEDATKCLNGRFSDSCKTAFRPYDLAVQCVLLIAKHHLKDRISVWSGGSDYHWNDARRLCYLHLSYPFSIESIAKQASFSLESRTSSLWLRKLRHLQSN